MARKTVTAPANIGEALADLTTLRRLIAEMQAKYEPASQAVTQGAALTTPNAVKQLLGAEMAALVQEQLRVVLLNTKNVVMDILTIYQGTVNSSTIRVAEIMRPAIVGNAVSIIVVHNHPSGDTAPSPEDVRTTKLIYDAGEMLGIELLDHIIVGRDFYGTPTTLSLKHHGLGFPLSH